jgi:hypothetical protein
MQNENLAIKSRLQASWQLIELSKLAFQPKATHFVCDHLPISVVFVATNFQSRVNLSGSVLYFIEITNASTVGRWVSSVIADILL